MNDRSHPRANASTDQSQKSDSTDTGAAGETPEILDWDFCIEIKPRRHSGTVNADAEFVGRGRPIPLDDPHAREAS